MRKLHQVTRNKDFDGELHILPFRRAVLYSKDEEKISVKGTYHNYGHPPS